jgi:hypothetical protein
LRVLFFKDTSAEHIQRALYTHPTLFDHAGVDHGGGDVLVAQKLLHRADKLLDSTAIGVLGSNRIVLFADFGSDLVQEFHIGTLFPYF